MFGEIGVETLPGGTARMSGLIWRHIYIYIYELHTKEGINPNVIFTAIEEVELEAALNGTKTAPRARSNGHSAP